MVWFTAGAAEIKAIKAAKAAACLQIISSSVGTGVEEARCWGDFSADSWVWRWPGVEALSGLWV